MRILWITNIPIGRLCNVTKTTPLSGGWMAATLEKLQGIDSIEICVATTWPVKKRILFKESNVEYVLLPGGFPIKYDPDNKSNIVEWEQLVSQFNPDIVQIWGTEFSHSLGCIRFIKGIPVIVYIQGIMSQIAKEYLAGMSPEELRKAKSLRDIIRHDTIEQQQQKFYKRALLEKEILLLSQGVIIENKWAKIHCLSINDNLTIFTSSLAINKVFFNTNWRYKEIDKYSIMCNSADYPIKGLHILLKAIFQVKKKYPRVKLSIPGMKNILNHSLKQRILNTGYINYLSDLIKKLGLEENISFLGSLSSAQMAFNMKKSHVFVVPSALENHSGTLREALIVGTPSITSYVGGVPEIIKNGINAFLYRFEEHEILAYYITEIFASKELAENLSRNAKSSIRKNHDPDRLQTDFLEIYKAILKRSNPNQLC